MSGTTALDELRRIYSENGTLTPQMVVDAARPDEAPLHDRFEWDDSVAGEKYRLVQAGVLIRKAHVKIETGEPRGPVQVRAFLAKSETVVEPDVTEPWSYTSIEDLDDRAAQVILEQMQRDVAALRRKYRDHKAVLDRLLLESVEVA